MKYQALILDHMLDDLNSAKEGNRQLDATLFIERLKQSEPPPAPDTIFFIEPDGVVMFFDGSEKKRLTAPPYTTAIDAALLLTSDIPKDAAVAICARAVEKWMNQK